MGMGIGKGFELKESQGQFVDGWCVVKDKMAEAGFREEDTETLFRGLPGVAGKRRGDAGSIVVIHKELAKQDFPMSITL